MFPDLRQIVLDPLLVLESFEEGNLRSVGRRKISPLNRRAIPPTIIATPIVLISNAQKSIVAAVSKIGKAKSAADSACGRVIFCWRLLADRLSEVRARCEALKELHHQVGNGPPKGERQ